MAVLIHVSIALISIAFTTFLFFTPSRAKFLVNYALIGLTFASGTYLVVSTHSALLSACISGLTYLTIVTVGSVLAHARLLRAEAKTRITPND